VHVRLLAAVALVGALVLPGGVRAGVSFKSGAFEVESLDQPGITPGPLAVLDLNKDGKLDLTTAASTTGQSYWVTIRGDGNGGFSAPITESLTDVADLPNISLLAADIDGDGAPDLLYGDGDQSMLGELYLTRGTPNTYTGGGGSMAAGDLNGDGKTDVVASEWPGLVVFLGNGDGTFQDRRLLSGPGFGFFQLADCNSDGRQDLVIANSPANRVEVELGNGDGTFKPPLIYALGASPGPFVAADLNKDGKVDVATVTPDTNAVAVLSGNGDGTFSAAASYAVGKVPLPIVTADFDRDGKPDLATGNRDSVNVSVLLGSGTGAFAAAKNFDVPGTVATAQYAPLDLVTADLNRDKWPDLAATTYLPNHGGRHQGVFSVFLNAGGGNVTPPGAKCVVPNVIGKPLATAKKALKKALCKLGKVSYKPSTKKKKGRVLAESPKAGKKLAANSKVNLTLGKGPKKK
jgi:FG-GAP-like repeat/PASTA domain